MFLYYRRRRLRYYRGEEWPFPTLPANGRPGRRRKEEKDFGEVPEMYECLLDVKGDDDGSGHVHPAAPEDVWGGATSTRHNGSRFLEEDLARWQPVAITSLDTRAIPSTSAPTDPASGSATPSRPSNLFARTLSTSRHMFSPSGGLQSVGASGSATPTTTEQGLSTYTPSTGTAYVPLNVTYLIAMPSAQKQVETQRRHSAVTTYGDDDDVEGEEIPELELGLTGVHLEVPGLSVVTSGQRGVAMSQGEDETTRRRLFRKGNQAGTGNEAQAGEVVATNSAIGADGTLDLFALLNQTR